MVQLVIDDDAIPKYNTIEQVPPMNPGTIVEVKGHGYFVEDGK